MVLLVVHLCLLLRWLDWLKDRGQNNERSGNGGGASGVCTYYYYLDYDTTIHASCQPNA